MKKIFFLFIVLLLITGCTKDNKTDFEKLYNVDNSLVETISFSDFKKLTENKTGIVFIGDDSDQSKKLAKVFIDNLCECDVNKAHFINIKNVDEKDLKNFLKIETLNYPIIIAYKVGKQTGYYDGNTKTDDVNKYINDLIMSAYPTVCTDAC
jgi:hypothetical protein